MAKKKQTKRAITRRYNKKVRALGKPVRVKKASRKKVFAVQQAMINDLERQLMHSNSRIVELEKDLMMRTPKIATWTTAEGDTMMLSQMEDRHLQNTIFYLFRRLTASFGSARYLDSMTRNVSALLDMLQEAQKRGLRV